jgi:hypothetical protein
MSIDLKEKFHHVQRQMQAKLEELRVTHEHKGVKGSGVEVSVREFLRVYLPRRLEIGHGEVIDAEGRISGQTDIVITHEDHPFTCDPREAGLFFIEGVSAAGEVKSLLTSDELDSSIKNSRRFKQLKLDPGKWTMAHGTPSDTQRYLVSPAWFLVAVESQLTLETVFSKVSAAAGGRTICLNEMVDAIFLLDRGVVINFGDGGHALQFRNPDGVPQAGWIPQQTDAVLFELLSWLSASIPKMIRFAPIIPRYLQAARTKAT